MANQQTAAKYRGEGDKQVNHATASVDKFNNALNPFGNLDKGQGIVPFYSTGARSLIRIGGRPVGICTSMSYNLSYNVEEIRTIDTNVPWDLDVGAASIRAQLSTIVDPTGGPEFYSLFATLASSVHQPMVEMQVLDAATGTSIFFARGVFSSVSFNTAKGSLSSWSANFTGTYFQNYVSQTFVPYSAVGRLGKSLTNLVGGLSNLTGGLL